MFLTLSKHDPVLLAAAAVREHLEGLASAEVKEEGLVGLCAQGAVITTMVLRSLGYDVDVLCPIAVENPTLPTHMSAVLRDPQRGDLVVDVTATQYTWDYDVAFPPVTVGLHAEFQEVFDAWKHPVGSYRAVDELCLRYKWPPEEWPGMLPVARAAKKIAASVFYKEHPMARRQS